jgi:hypothetical protein
MLILEVARPGGQKFTKALVGGIIASSVSFGIYFTIVGAVFLDAYKVPSYEFEDWQLLAAIPLRAPVVFQTAGALLVYVRWNRCVGRAGPSGGSGASVGRV